MRRRRSPHEPDRDNTMAAPTAGRRPWRAGVACVLLMCASGCARTDVTPSENNASSVAESVFSRTGEPSRCPAHCISGTVAVAREALGLDPGQSERQVAADPQALFESLDREGSDVGSTITRLPAGHVINELAEGPTSPAVLVHKTGHLYVVFGAIRVNDELLCQLAHGNEPVSLLAKQTLSEGGFQEAWRFQKKRARVPIHIGSAVLEVDRLWHNFGEVLPGTSPECEFHLENVGDKTVILDKPAVSCQCAVPNLREKAELPPSTRLALKVITKATGVASLRNTVMLTPYEKGTGKSRQLPLALIGSQRTAMEVTPTRLDFGQVVPGIASVRTVSLREKPADRFVLQQIDPGKLPIGHNVEMTKDKDGLATYRVHLELKVDETWSGEHREELKLTTDSRVRPEVTIPVVFRIEPPVRASRSVIALGTVVVGEPREERVELLSRSGEPVAVEITEHPQECSIKLDERHNPVAMIVSVTLRNPGIWQGAIRARTRTSLGKEALEIRCVGYARKRKN